jgi:enediyne biosynthesis protein E4
MIRSKIILVLLVVFLTNCQSDNTLFKSLKPTDTGVTFENKLTDSESQNILAYEYFYNGGGMAAADFNNDGLTDLFFVGNQVENKLYLNKSRGSSTQKGDFLQQNSDVSELKFEDITQKAGVDGRHNAWKTGVAVADVNADGWLDIYVCYSGNGTPESRKNQLFINPGKTPNPSGEGWGGVFTEQAEDYGIADTGYSTQATFFDYDQDGDLDLFVMNHNLKNYQRKEAAFMKTEVDANAGDRLYRNDSSPDSGGGFTDVTSAARINSNALGFGLGVVVADFNKDNWPDLYVANDYVEEDYLYLNQTDGTFRECGREAMGHFSYSSMGVDAADINNDGWPDLFTADMLPEDNRRQKLLAFPDNWNVQQSMLTNGFHWQNMRNMLQVNSPLPSGRYAVRGGGGVLFSEIGQLAGVSNTDWSWSPLFADFDNDGYKDLFVSNGFVKDLTDLDFVKYQSDEAQNTPLLEQLKKMPSTPTHHYIFKNNGNLTFDNKTTDWGFDQPATASGAVYADLDNDGDWDIVTNNTNEPARIYQNQSQQQKPSNYLKVKLKGTAKNPFAVGSKVIVYAKGQQQYQELWPTHGFQSSVVQSLHFGLGNAQKVDSIKVVWPDGSTRSMVSGQWSIVKNEINVSYESEIKNQKTNNGVYKLPTTNYKLSTTGIAFSHLENPVIDFNRQILIPYLYSSGGAHTAVGDVNGDGLDDVFAGGALNQSGAIFLQKPDGSFQKTNQPTLETDAIYEDRDAVFFDADNDHDLDLYVVSGGYELVQDDPLFQDRLYLNNGKGRFAKGILPKLLTNKSCVKAADFDHDDDVDLFVGGFVKPGRYPMNDLSYVLTNNGKGQFTTTQTLDLGLVTDAAIADIDNDKNLEIVVTAEWKPVQVISQWSWVRGKKESETRSQKSNNQHSITKVLGHWSAIKAADLDNDGDVDFVVGNLGLNTQLKASEAQPISLYYSDFDQNGSTDPFITYFNQGKAFPLASRDEALEQVVALKKKFINYKTYSTATIEDIFTNEQLVKAKKLTITETRSGLIINNKGTFTFKPLPIEAQFAPVYAIGIDDLNNDGKKDLILAGNNSTMRIRIGKMDANYGMVFLNNGKNEFTYLPQSQSGLWLKGDVRDCQTVKTKQGKQWIFSINNSPIQTYSSTGL